MPTLQLPTWNQGYDYWDIPKENNEYQRRARGAEEDEEEKEQESGMIQDRWGDLQVLFKC